MKRENREERRKNNRAIYIVETRILLIYLLKFLSIRLHGVLAYQNRVSGPIRDRIDILLSLKPVNLKDANFGEVEPSEKIRERVALARSKQYHRYGGKLTNGEVLFDQLVATSPLSMTQKEMLEAICIKQGLSNRVHIKIIRLARTIADLRGEEAISDAAICEAFKLRNLEYKQVPMIVASREGEYHG